MKAQLDRAQLETSNTKADLRILDRERASRGELMAAQEEHTAIKEELEKQEVMMEDAEQRGDTTTLWKHWSGS